MTFGDIKIGQFFSLVRDPAAVYMKTDRICVRPGAGYINCVIIKDVRPPHARGGWFHFIADDDEIIPEPGEEDDGIIGESIEFMNELECLMRRHGFAISNSSDGEFTIRKEKDPKLPSSFQIETDGAFLIASMDDES